jgi:propionyl-CoA carboxylase alpha chain
VRLQIRIAEGHPLEMTQEQVVRRGHAIECRICAEDPANNFFPSTGRLLAVEMPAGPFVRVDSGVQQGDEVSMFYDPLLAKLVVWGADRREAIERMLRALGEMAIVGVRTTAPFCRAVLESKAFVSGSFDTHFVADHFKPSELDRMSPDEEVAAAVATAMMQATAHRTSAPDRQRTMTPWKRQRTDTYR